MQRSLSSPTTRVRIGGVPDDGMETNRQGHDCRRGGVRGRGMFNLTREEGIPLVANPLRDFVPCPRPLGEVDAVLPRQAA